MNKMKPMAFAIPLMVMATAADTDNAKPYAGFQDRKIASLSQNDIEDISNGLGWGLALPAELNGYPGPTHVLDMKDELNLSEAQTSSINSIFMAMRTEAILAGNKFLAAEIALNEAFQSKTITPQTLAELIQIAAVTRGELRNIHLQAHLKTVEILRLDQISRYNDLRGYDDDPCLNIPEGHSEEMWRLHNGCK